MKAKIMLSCAAVLAASIVGAIGSVTPSNPLCDGAAVLALRINGCDEQPCTIKKGDGLPYEVDMTFYKEIAFAQTLGTNVFISYYAVPPDFYGSYLSNANCNEYDIGVNCPVSPNVNYTITSELYIDPKSECRAACESMGPGGTGLRETYWSFRVSNGDTGGTIAFCNFDVTLNITE